MDENLLNSFNKQSFLDRSNVNEKKKLLSKVLIYYLDY